MARCTLIFAAIISCIFFQSCKTNPQEPPVNLTLPAAQPAQDPAEYKQIKEKLAEAAMQKFDPSTRWKGRGKGKFEFNEWLHGKTGKPLGEQYQGWSAGTYIYAYRCVKERRAIYFE